ncbi:putative pentatricopeptide repeat-containing protein [Capsicum chinense]|nr:putative pentatricopeptide repeat-containing protein [Capsicum chinense]
MNPTSSIPPKALLELKTALFHGFHSLNQLKHIHARIIRYGFMHNNYLLNLLLKFTLNNFNHPNYAQLLFNQAREPNIYVYNTMIRGLVSNNCYEEGIYYFYAMREEGFFPDHFTFPFLFKCCTRLFEFDLGVKAHGVVVKMGYDCDVFVNTGLVCLYSKCGLLDDAHKVFDDMREDLKNVVSWTAIMTGYIGVGKFREAIELFRRSLEMGSRPDSFSIVRVLLACSRVGDVSTGEWIHGYAVEMGMGRNVFVNTGLIDMYGKCGKMVKAREVFDGMVEKDVVSWSAMIQGYAANGLPKEALEVFYRMQREGVRPDCYSMVGLLSACARLGALEVGEWASRLMERDEFFDNAVLGTALIDMYAKCGRMVSAWEIFRQMTVKDRVVWNAVVSGLAMHGHVKSALCCFGQVEKLGLKPDGNTFIGLLCACTHAGLVGDGRKYFHSMTHSYSLEPAIEHYGCMVDLLGRAGLLDEAHSLIGTMPMKANAVIWGALLSGCRLHRDTKLAEHVLKQLIQLEPWNSGNYVLLSNIYASNNKWDDSERVRSSLNEAQMQKIPAYSWIEIDGVVHEFLVGDTYHSISEKIYAKLSELSKELREAGYVPRTEYVLFDIEEEEKEQFVGCHSEKLALAFGLLRTRPSEVIRIIKNLRICGDCHTFFKHVSKISEREIILRDNNRFHCFLKGSCSCGDYW